MGEVHRRRRNGGAAEQHLRRPPGSRPGGTDGLVAFLAEHQDAVEADLLRYYQIDLPRDLGSERLTWRRLRVLLEHLPPDSATVRKVSPAAAWGLTDHLLALVADQLAIANWQRANTGRKKGQQTKAPAPIPRPGLKPSRNERRFGGEGMPIAELRKRLAKTTGR